MAKLAAFILVLATFVLESDGEVSIAFPQDSLIPSVGLNSFCMVKNESFVGWFKEKGNIKIPIVPSRADVKDKVSVVVETNGNEKTCIIIFPKGSPVSAGGRYRCQGGKNKAYLDVQVKFSLDSLKKTQSIHLGENQKIVLGALAYPLANFIWTKNSNKIVFETQTRLTQEDDGSISINNVQRSDAGLYKVNINWLNRVVLNEDITVNVIAKPSFFSVPDPKKLDGVSGYDYEFCCNDTGIPEPSLKWYKVQGPNEVEIDVTNARYSVDDNCMSIKTLQKGDEATYKCISTNSAGSASATVQIEKVGVKPTVEPFPEYSMTKSVKKPLEIDCFGKGEPLPTMEWTTGGKVFKNQIQVAGRSTMNFTSLRLEDTANYTCTAKNGLKYDNKEFSDSRVFQLNVIAKPLLNLKGSPTPVYSFIGNPNSVLVRCVFDGFPDPFVEIVKDGVQVANGTRLVSLRLITNKDGKFGDYVCNAKNVHGTATHTVNLKKAVAPDKPTNVKATKTCNSISISWEPPISNGGMMILQYVISSKKDGEKFRAQNVNTFPQKHKLAHVFKPETTYRVEISARNGYGVGEAETVEVTTNKYCKPSPPTIGTIGGKRTRADMTVKGPNVMVTWQKPQNNGFDKNLRYLVEWRVQRKRIKRATEENKWETSGEVQKTEYEIKGLKKGKYEIKVSAVNQAGRGNPDMRVVNVEIVSESPVAGKRTGGLSKGAIAGIVIAILLIVLITIDLFCCFFNSCGVIFCCQRACCGGKYSPDGKDKKDQAEMEKLKKDPAPEKV